MSTWLERIRGKLISEWRSSWKFWSIRLNALAVVLSPLAVIGDAAPAIVSVLPAEVAALIDPDVLRFAPFVLVVASMALRLVKQKGVA